MKEEIEIQTKDGEVLSQTDYIRKLVREEVERQLSEMTFTIKPKFNEDDILSSYDFVKDISNGNTVLRIDKDKYDKFKDDIHKIASLARVFIEQKSSTDYYFNFWIIGSNENIKRFFDDLSLLLQ